VPDLAGALFRQPRDPATARRAAHDILAQPQFRLSQPSLFDRARHWAGQQLSRLLDDIVGGHLGVIGAVVLVLIVALLVWLAVVAVRGVQVDRRPGGVELGSLRRPAADWLAEAADCERRGDWRGALRARYRALVAELAGRGLVEEIPGRTTGEYRTEVGRSLPGAAPEFGSATDLFELAVYGDGPAGPPETERLRELADRVLAGTR
jgi:hypothetical protein